MSYTLILNALYLVSQDALGRTQGMAHEEVSVAGDKANQMSSIGEERLEQAKQAVSEAAEISSNQTVNAMDVAGSILQQAGSALENVAKNLKDAVTTSH